MGHKRMLSHGREVRDPCLTDGCILSKGHEDWGIGHILRTADGYLIERSAPARAQ